MKKPDDDILYVTARGGDLLSDASLNKGSAFTNEERIELGLEGLLPHHVSNLDEQVQRVLENFRRQATPIDKHVYLRSLQDRNETLFYAALISHLAEMMPIVYTPTVAQAVEEFSHLFAATRGLYLTPEDSVRMEEVIGNVPCEDVRVVVCTDNEGILGIGDQGTGGMAIPIGKLALYVAAGGFRPDECLPVCLDVGTDNRRLLEDPLYLGVKQPRLRGAEYDSFIDSFVEGFKKRLPNAILQWEDFSRDIAFENLIRYRDEVCSFNDDIQGTASVTVASLMGAAKLAGRSFAKEVICIVGAGCAGVGVTLGILDALQSEGLSLEEAKERVYVFDSRGLLVDTRPGLPDYKRQVATPASVVEGWGGLSLYDVIERVRPTALVGLSGHPGAIDEEAVRTMAELNERPSIFAMSNPTANAEAVPADILCWSDGRAIITTGSPFDPVEYKGKEYQFSQANNVYVFPGVGLGAAVCGATRITDRMLTSAARRLHELTDDADYERGLVLPPVRDLRSVSAQIGAAVMESAIREGLAAKPAVGDLAKTLRDGMYQPHYTQYKPAK